MGNVVAFAPARRAHEAPSPLGTLADCFRTARMPQGSVLWLKENAELLNIVECTRPDGSDEIAGSYGHFYAEAERRFAFFPQYYRFLLSIAMDLEDLGHPGEAGEALANRVLQRGLFDGELSDLQRAEVRRLLHRRGVEPACDGALDDRLRAYVAAPANFAVPNRKAAYELTHIVFYLSEYGRRDPGLMPETRTSLHYAGLIAFLEQNADLLAEVSIALGYAGWPVPDYWSAWLGSVTSGFAVQRVGNVETLDDYHSFLVCNWFAMVRGKPLTAPAMPDGPAIFIEPSMPGSALRAISERLYEMGTARSADWHKMRSAVVAGLTPRATQTLAEAEAATPDFESFFKGFARVEEVAA